MAGPKKRNRSGLFWLGFISLFCLGWGGFSLGIAGRAILTGEIALSVFWRGTRRGGGQHLWVEQPGMFLFALFLVTLQGALIFWMGWGLGKALLVGERSKISPPLN